MAEYVINHALNCASLIPVPDFESRFPDPCSCGAEEHERRAQELNKRGIPLEQVGELEENEQGLSGLFKLHGVELSAEALASVQANMDRERILTMSVGEVRSVSSTGAEKGVKEARFDLLPVGPLTELAVHFGRGAQKYEPHNYRKGYEYSKGYAALQRHANAWWAGEDLDPEMQTSHLAAVAFHALALLEFTTTHPEMDDRFIL
ncbi:hypothetical protein KDJ01_gp51 [Arthrobacter phage Kittykat]|uniref:dATP/dGTP diphosphohydrolase N-terminal domain-containing protein n=1 Tax=Arthrobacter phage Kittykat TaxID=2794944 RepID=A0A7T1NXL0_9CAUD|nr:hypothetical protein KDJ01_gp51 [Arthrobacter phage Kittykat]QPO16982.1 hypothetical protein SEA_KITTYKAT_51 [Arthrobacter phage Kittykat]